MSRNVVLCLPKAPHIQIETPLTPYDRIASNLLKGISKENLTHWWLELIEARTDHFLQTVEGYDINAVPYNYIDQPPKSLDAIRLNQVIVHQILDSVGVKFAADVYQVKTRLIAPLKTEIYEAIERFLFHLAFVISNQLDIPIPTDILLKNSMVEYLMNEWQNRRDKISKDAELIQNLFHDIDYIKEMKKLEEHFDNFASNSQSRSGPSDIVPITGLILGRLHRIENELSTVLEHWSKRLKNHR